MQEKKHMPVPKSHTFDYAIKVWLTAVVIAPLLVIFLLMDYSAPGQDVAGLLAFWIYSLVLGLIFSIPSFIALYLCVRMVNRQPWASVYKKLLLAPAGVVLAALPFYIVFCQDDAITQAFNIKWAACYALSIVAALLCFKLRPGN